MSRTTAIKIVTKYAKHLQNSGFSYSEVYLYGSHAQNKDKESSDIDVCVVSPLFDAKDWDKKRKKLWYLRRDIDVRIEPIGVSPEEFENTFPLADEIKKNGILIDSK